MIETDFRRTDQFSTLNVRNVDSVTVEIEMTDRLTFSVREKDGGLFQCSSNMALASLHEPGLSYGHRNSQRVLNLMSCIGRVVAT